MEINLFDAQILLGQLADDTPELREALVGGAAKTVHWDVLQSYFLTNDVAKRHMWAAPLRRLIELRAPVDRGEMWLPMALSFGNWAPTADLTADLMRAYLASGLYRPAERLPGELRGASKARTDEGQLPLASAILWDNADAVRVLCEANVSWDLGPVQLDGPPRQAYEFAAERGSRRCMAVLAEVTMRNVIATNTAIASPKASAAGGRRSMAL